MMWINKIFTILVISVCISLLCPVETHGRARFQLFGALGRALQMGDVSDYIAGDNDFPVTPSHFEYGGGLGIMFNLSQRLDFQVTGEYLFGANVDKTDPTDGETYVYRTYDNINILASLLLKFGSKPRFFLTAGGGMNILKPYNDKEVTGSLGSVILIEAPEKKTNPMVVFGGGVLLNAGRGFFKVEALYAMIFDYDKKSILIRVGYAF
jgi:hypothetical protein